MVSKHVKAHWLSGYVPFICDGKCCLLHLYGIRRSRTCTTLLGRAVLVVRSALHDAPSFLSKHKCRLLSIIGMFPVQCMHACHTAGHEHVKQKAVC